MLPSWLARRLHGQLCGTRAGLMELDDFWIDSPF